MGLIRSILWTLYGGSQLRAFRKGQYYHFRSLPQSGALKAQAFANSNPQMRSEGLADSAAGSFGLFFQPINQQDPTSIPCFLGEPQRDCSALDRLC